MKAEQETEEKGLLIMGAPKNMRLPMDFDERFPQGLYLVGRFRR
jgi:hypothetical protein